MGFTGMCRIGRIEGLNARLLMRWVTLFVNGTALKFKDEPT